MMKRVLILGHFGAGNLGDELMLRGLLGVMAETWPDQVHARVVWAGAYSLETPNRALISVEAVRPTIEAIWRALRDSDFVVVGGGTHFHDDYPLARMPRHWSYLGR